MSSLVCGICLEDGFLTGGSRAMHEKSHYIVRCRGCKKEMSAVQYMHHNCNYAHHLPPRPVRIDLKPFYGWNYKKVGA